MQAIRDFVESKKRAAILDSVRLTEPDRDKSSTRKRTLYCSPGWSLNLTKRQVHGMICKRRLCEQCGWYWAWKWRKALKEKAINDKAFGLATADKALTLTFAQNIPFLTMQDILRQFWKLLRCAYPKIEYWGAVEFNQNHTQPHIHFILANAPYLELDYLDYCFRVAQLRYKLEKLAFNLRIEKIRKNVEAYFTKYITKLTGGKDEIPRRALWQGRFIRYSRKFFPVPVAAIMAAAPYNLALKRGEKFERFVFRVRQPAQNLLWWYFDQIDEERDCDKIRAAGWNPEKDVSRGAILPEDDLLTNAGIIVVNNREITADLWYRYCKMRYAESGTPFGPGF